MHCWLAVATVRMALSVQFDGATKVRRDRESSVCVFVLYMVEICVNKNRLNYYAYGIEIQMLCCVCVVID